MGRITPRGVDKAAESTVSTSRDSCAASNVVGDPPPAYGLSSDPRSVGKPTGCSSRRARKGNCHHEPADESLAGGSKLKTEHGIVLSRDLK